MRGDAHNALWLGGGISKEGEGSTLAVRHAETENVVVFSAAERPSASDRRLLARIPRLVAYLDAH